MRLQKKYKKLFNFVLVLFITMNFFVGQKAEAASASLYLTPSTGTFVINSIFKVSVKINSGGQVINAAEGTVNFDKNLLEVVSVSKGGAIFNLWTTEPSFSNSAGTISFGGGIPRPGYNGSAGHVCTITFKAKNVGTAQASFVSGAVLANDGKGTNILSSMGSASFSISPKVTAPESGKAESGEKSAEPKKETEIKELERNKPVITSPTHPDQEGWYKNRNIKFNWILGTGINNVSMLFNNNPVSDPGNEADGLISEKEYLDASDGLSYFHLKYKDGTGWGTIAHYKVQIDNKPPLPFDITVKQDDLNDWPTLYFKAVDELSGLSKYELFIDSLEQEAIVIGAEEASYKVQPLEIGTHTAIVRAIDKAGNETLSTTPFNITPIETPVIINYLKELKSSDKFFISGSALPDVSVNLYIQKSNSENIITQIVTSDKDGNWYIVLDETLSDGRYLAWVEAKNKLERKSSPSNKVSFLVTPPVFTIIGDYVINYFTVFVSLIFLILLVIMMFIYLMEMIRKRLRKETIEIEEVLHKNLEDLRKEFDEDMVKISKAKTIVEKKKLLIKFKSKIDTTEESILKEIQDVEKILK